MSGKGEEEMEARVNSSLMLAGMRGLCRTGCMGAGKERSVCLVFHVLFNYKCRKLANKQRDGKGGGGGTDSRVFV